MCEYITNNGSDPTNYKPTKKMKTTENATSKAAQPDPVLAFEVFMSMHFEDLEDLEELAYGTGIIDANQYGEISLETSDLVRQFAAAEAMKRTGRA